jgi:hypothetical protein
MNGRPALVLVGIAFCVAFGFVTTSAKSRANTAGQHDTAQPALTAQSPKKAEEQFKNIQVLKGIPAEQLIPSMMFITASLGVQCDFCHVQNAFEKDDKKPKQTARQDDGDDVRHQ